MKISTKPQIRELTQEEDNAIRTAALSDPDAHPLTDAQLAQMRPAREVMPARTLAAFRRAGRPPGSAKESTTIRFDMSVLAAFRAGGPGWQTRMNNALKDWLKTHSPA
jgi:uncharacterized protein (DUF4415 family)